MSKVFNMVGGGGKNISSIIITGLESTDTITCTKDGKSYTATWDSTAQHWEIVGLPLGTFTVTATNGTKTKTETVLIDISGVYEIEMTFKLWLYRYGDEFEDVTGGWQKTYFANGSGGTATKNETNLYMVGANASNWGNCGFATVNPISCEGYSKLYILADNHPASGSRNFANVTNGYGNQGNSFVQELLLSTIGDNLIIDASDLLSSLNNKHLFINAAYYTHTMTIHSVWLE